MPTTWPVVWGSARRNNLSRQIGMKRAASNGEAIELRAGQGYEARLGQPHDSASIVGSQESIMLP